MDNHSNCFIVVVAWILDLVLARNDIMEKIYDIYHCIDCLKNPELDKEKENYYHKQARSSGREILWLTVQFVFAPILIPIMVIYLIFTKGYVFLKIIMWKEPKE